MVKKKAKKQEFKSVSGKKFDSVEAYLATKAKRPESKFSILLGIIKALVAKGAKDAKIVIAKEKAMKEKKYTYVAKTLPNAILKVIPKGDLYRIGNTLSKEMPKNDTTGNKTNAGYVEFHLIKR